MKKSLIIVLALAFMFSMVFASFVFADAENPSIVIDPISGPLTFTSFPQQFNVTGSFDSPQVKDLTLYVNDVSESVDNNVNYHEAGGTFSLPWNITGPGTYTLKVTGTHGGQDSYDEQTVEVQLIIVVDYPAAPAVANRLLKSATFIPKLFKNTGAIITLVANKMAPTASFNDVAKSDVAAYEEAVKEYLEGMGIVF